MKRTAIIALAAGLSAGLLVGGGVAYAATSSKTVKVCVTSKSVVRSATTSGKCPSKTKAVSINKVGPTGKTGATGPKGDVGPKGPVGPQGPGASTIDVVLPETVSSTSVGVYDDPFLTVEVACTDSSVNIFYDGSQGDHFSGTQQRVTFDGSAATTTTSAVDNFSSSGFSGKTAAVLHATVTGVGTTASRQIDVTVLRSDSTHCRVTGRITP